MMGHGVGYNREVEMRYMVHHNYEGEMEEVVHHKKRKVDM